jgi:ankyrin repeat protein
MGLDVNEKGWEGRTLLMLTQCPEVAELLLQRGAEVDAGEPDDWTALMWSAWKGDVEVMRVLIDHGADVNVQCSVEKRTPLIVASESDVISIAEWVGRPNKDQPLLDHHRLLATVKLLVERGADVNRADVHGATPICYALRYKCLNVVEFLIENGARTDISKKFEERLRQAAIEYQRPRLTELLKESQE